MKKAVKILCIAGGCIAAAGAAVFAFVPGVFTYCKVIWQYPNIGRTIPQYAECSVPEDFLPYTVRGLSVSVPADYTLRDSGSGFIDGEGNVAILVMRTDKTETAKLVDPWKNYAFEEADYRSYFQAVGAPFPTADDARTEILWYSKGTLMPEDCLKLRGRNRKIFCEMAETKNSAWDMEDTWELPLSGGKAYVSYSDNDIITKKPYMTLTVYPDDSRNEEIFLLIRSDTNTAKQIIASAKLTE